MRRGGLLLAALLGCHAAAPGTAAPPAARAGALAAAPLDRGACCRACLGASERDPIGMAIERQPCARYRGEWNGGPGVSGPCADLFEREGTLVGDCAALSPR